MTDTPLVAISSFCRTGSGTTPARSNDARYFGGNIPWVKSGELRETEIFDTEEKVTEAALTETSLKMVPANSLLVAMYGATVGRVGILRVPATTNQAICHIVPDPTRADTQYIFHLLQWIAPIFVNRGVGGAQPNISQGIIKDAVVPLPPLDEQRRIAAILDHAENLRRWCKAALQRSSQFGHVLFQSLFGDLDQPKYAVQNLGTFTTEIYRYPTYYDIEYTEDGIPEIRGELIKVDGSIISDKARLRYISPQTSRRFPKTILSAGDLIMSVRGTIGKLGLVPRSLEGANITANLIRIAPERKTVHPLYLWYAMSSRMTKAALVGASSTTTIATIKAPDLRSLPVISAPINEQRIFVERTESFRVVERRMKCQLTRLEALFSSFQNQAFGSAECAVI